MTNITPSIKEKIGRNLHNKVGHPIKIIKEHIYKYFTSLKGYDFKIFDNLSPYVTVENNFDLLRIPKDHPSRSKHDSYYVDDNVVLRTHTSAHQNELLKDGYRSFLVSGDVYRKDEIDRYHYPVFHQMEGVHIVANNIDPKKELQTVLGGLIEYLFPKCKYRFNNDYFPFTNPSFEAEVEYQGEWLEILGCGVIHREILDRHNIKENGFAFGLGIERLAIILFNIPDIRYFWTNDQKFHEQFKQEKIVQFKPYSKLKPIAKDISFWLDEKEIVKKDNNTFDWININMFYEIVREICRDNIERAELIEKFYNAKKNKFSILFRLHIEPNQTEISSLKNIAVLTDLANKFAEDVGHELQNRGYVVRSMHRP